MGYSNHYLYRHIRTDKEIPFYIGIGTKYTNFCSFTKEYERAFSSSGRNYIWTGITNRTDYKVEIILEYNDYDFIKEKETEFINLYGKIIDENGTLSNFTDGGDGVIGLKHSEESKNKISKKSTKYKVAQYNLNGTLLKIWDSVNSFCDFYNCGNYSAYSVLNKKQLSVKDYQLLKVYDENEIKHKIPKILSEKERISNSRTGLKRSEDTKRKMSLARTGKKLSEKTKEKLRQHNLGNVASDKDRKKQSEAQLGKDGTIVKHIESGKEYNSLAKACRELNLNYKREDARIRNNYSTKNFIKIE